MNRSYYLATIVLAIGLVLTACGVTSTAQARPTVQPSPQATSEVGQPQYTYPAPVVESSPIVPATPEIVLTPSILYAPGVIGVVTDKNHVVVHVEPASGAEKAGIQVGDTIVSINDVMVGTDSANAKQEIRKTKIGNSVSIKARRQRADLDLPVQVLPMNAGLVSDSPQPPLTATPVLPPMDYF